MLYSAREDYWYLVQKSLDKNMCGESSHQNTAPTTILTLLLGWNYLSSFRLTLRLSFFMITQILCCMQSLNSSLTFSLIPCTLFILFVSLIRSFCAVLF